MSDNDLAGGPIEKPSFLSFLKKSKEKQDGQGKRKQNGARADESSASPENGSSPDKAGQDKSQIRRAQVRRAQIQHRQRKANYIKQLELDINQLREMVNQIQRDTRSLKFENDEIRTVLIHNGVLQSPGLLSPSATTNPTTAAEAVTPIAADQDVNQLVLNLQSIPSDNFGADNEMLVTLKSDKLMGTPSFSISPSAASSDSLQCPIDQSWGGTIVQLTPAQEMLVVNFILALEHCCWDHFWAGDCHHHAAQSEEEKGHTLMASSYVMASAPESVYGQRKAFTSRFKSSPTLQWQSSAVSLESLYGLAQSINSGEEEIVPVQAWFELARRYPVDYLISKLVDLKREFKGVARCVVYGAAIEKTAFESIALRILGPPQTLNFAFDS